MNRAAGTALGPMLIAALECREPHPALRDELAGPMLPAAGRMMAAAGRAAPVRRWLFTVGERTMPGLWGSLVCRKRYIDDALADAVESGVDAVLILGAGMDTRAYRPPLAGAVPVLEVDQPINVGRKRAALHRVFGRVPDGVTLLPVDLGRHDLGAALAHQGFALDRRLFVIWEAVTQYLTADDVAATLDVLSGAGAGSRLAFTYVRRDFLDGTNLYGAARAHRNFVRRQRLWTFGLHPDGVAGLLAEHGWSEVEQVGPAEYAGRYLASRGLAASEIERAVLAERD